MIESHISSIQRDLQERFGMKHYKREDGFTQAELFDYAGRRNDVCTLTLRKGSVSEGKYGEDVTCVLTYLLNERTVLEKDAKALDANTHIRADACNAALNAEQVAELKSTGIETKDIVELLVLPYTSENNTFASKNLRTPKKLSVPFEAEGGGQDIGWIYGALCRFKEREVGLMPDEEAQYLAYKLILEPEQLTPEEHAVVFDKNNAICNQEVAYHYLLWKKVANRINEKEQEYLHLICQNHFYDRFALVDKELNNMGLSCKKLAEKYPSHAVLLLIKILEFKDVRFNVVGKFPLYMNFETMLHIYLRHVKELEVEELFGDRDKLQLAEEDIISVMRIVMGELNDEYQKYKTSNPQGRFYRTGKMAYYYNGDYYNVYVNEDGRIETFYKGTGKKDRK